MPLATPCEQRNIDGKVHTRSRHDLALERVAVDVDDAGQDQEAARIDPLRRTGFFADGIDHAVTDAHGRILEPVPDEGAPTFDTDVHRHQLRPHQLQLRERLFLSAQLSTTSSTRSGANRERDVSTGSPDGSTSTLSTMSSGRPGTVCSRWASSASAEVAEIRVECRR